MHYSEQKRDIVWLAIENVIKKKRTRSLGVLWLCGSSQKLVFPVIASLQKIIKWTTNEVTQTPNYETVAKSKWKWRKFWNKKKKCKHIFTLLTLLYFIIHCYKCIENPCMRWCMSLTFPPSPPQARKNGWLIETDRGPIVFGWESSVEFVWFD